jgi:energy-coupling factor transporter ATP-binding protein EcfA2
MTPQVDISRIIVTKLFGHLSYNLDFANSSEDRGNRLALLYGDNGSGKTTLLRLLFHLLSPVTGKGHKSVVASTKFSKFCVELSNGTSVSAERTAKRFDGDVVLKIHLAGKSLAELDLKVLPEGVVRMVGKNDEEKLARFLNQLASLNMEVLFMRDNRRLTSNLDTDQQADDSEVMMRPEFIMEGRPDFIMEARPDRKIRALSLDRDQSLIQAIENVTSFFRQTAFAGSSKGETDTNRIYGDIIKGLVLPGKRSSAYSKTLYDSYLTRFRELASRNKLFVSVGLASPLLAEDMIESLLKAKPNVRSAIFNVLSPYIDSVQARLDALEDTRHTISQFTESLNSFLGNGKGVNFSIRDGLTIVGFDGDRLHPRLLSSGEKQLLTLFCHIVCIRGRSAVFMIDEPELSLNIKWQRRLVKSLLDCASGSAVQFIMASHSMELLSQHREAVVQLQSVPAQ